MRRLLVVPVVALAVMLGSTGRASAFWALGGPYYTTAAFPSVNPPGYYTNLYYYGWMYPWWSHYNYSHGPYAGWYQNGGVATYGGECGPNGCQVNYPGYIGGPQYGAPPYVPGSSPGSSHAGGPNGIWSQGGGGAPLAGTVSVNLPADAKLLFNGTTAEGSGTQRTFTTPPLQPGQAYAYNLTAEVVIDGRVRQVTERVVVRAGEETKVTLAAK